MDQGATAVTLAGNVGGVVSSPVSLETFNTVTVTLSGGGTFKSQLADDSVTFTGANASTLNRYFDDDSFTLSAGDTVLTITGLPALAAGGDNVVSVAAGAMAAGASGVTLAGSIEAVTSGNYPLTQAANTITVNLVDGTFGPGPVTDDSFTFGGASAGVLGGLAGSAFDRVDDTTVVITVGGSSLTAGPATVTVKASSMATGARAVTAAASTTAKTSVNATLTSSQNTVTITLAGGRFKAKSLLANNSVTFSGPDSSVLQAAFNDDSFTLSDDSTVLTITGLTLTGGSTSTTVTAAAMDQGATAVTLAGSTQRPGAPTNVTGTAGDAQVTLSWAAPLSNGGQSITGYKIESSTTPPAGPTSVGPRNGWVTEIANTGSQATSVVVPNLANGTTYYFRVSAINVGGTSDPSAPSAGITPTAPTPPGPNPPAPTAPGAPTIGTAVAGDTQATVVWTPPASDGGAPVVAYRIQQSTDSGATWTTVVATTASTATSRVVTGLVNGTAYRFRVAAINSVDVGAYSAASNSVTPTAGVPGAPTSVTAVAGNAEAIVGWVAPTSTGGSAITGYRIEQQRGSGEWAVALANTGSTTTNAVVTGLTNGESYRFRVAAINSSGTGANSEPSNAVTPEEPLGKTILIVGERAEVRGKPGIVITGESTGFSAGSIFKPWFRFPGETSFTEGSANISVASDGTFRWQRQTGKKFYAYVQAGDGTRSNRVIIPAN